ncbi:MAG: sulfotransferase [Caulobacterales bacterium]
MIRADELIAKAVREGGCPDRGESYKPGLDRFLAEVNRSTTVTPQGWAGAEAMLLDVLKARFAIEDWIVKHPDVVDAPVKRPVFITGLPRCGTTLLLNLLAHDPQFRTYGNWEANRETPPVEAAHIRDDPRIARKVAEVNAALDAGILDHRYHVEMGDEPGECVWLLGQDFKSYPWLIVSPAPNYFDWLYSDADMLAAYRHHKRGLQVMQSRAPGQWVLKFPSHAPFLDSLMAVYPDARVVFTHRDPIKPLGSSCSASWHVTQYFNDHNLDKVEIGRQTQTILERSLMGVCTFQERFPTAPMHDLYYPRFIADPLAEIRKLYDFMGCDLSDGIEAQMQKALERQRAQRGQVGRHEYSLEEYGLSEKNLPPIFEEYRQRYGLAPER